MPIIKFVTSGSNNYKYFSKNNYSNKYAVENLGEYITNDSKCEGSYGCVGMLNCTVEEAIQQMKETKKRFGKVGGRKAKHLVISVGQDEYTWLSPKLSEENMMFILENTLYELGYALYEIFYGYELLFGVHKDNKHLHMHVMINSVNMIDGNKISISPSDNMRIHQFIAEKIKGIAARRCAEILWL